MKNSAIAALAVTVLSPAMAQEPPAAGLDEVVIDGALEREAEAAGRLGLSNRETPAIVDVITQDELQAEGARNAIEALNAAPGVASGTLPGSMGSVSVRGFHRAVNYLYDGVRMANSDVGVRNWDAWAFERIEVIKGPASVMSGEGALAGAINFVPRHPVLGRTSGEMLASIGSFETGRLAGDINLPIGDTVAVRLNASGSRTDGWVDDTDSRTLAASGALLYRPSDRFSLELRADYFGDDYTTIYYGTPVVSRAVARDPSDAVSGSAGLVLDRAMRNVNFDVADGDMGSDTLWLRARAEYRLNDAWRIVSDSSWYTSDRNWQDSDEYTFNAGSGLIDRSLSLITHDHQYWNQRVHLAFDGQLAGLRNRFTVGAEVGATDFFTVRRFGTAASANPFDPVRGAFPVDTPANFGTRQDVTADVSSRALFAEDALNVTADWLLVAGARYDDFSLDRSVLNVTAVSRQNYGNDLDAISWRAGTVFSVTPQTQLFAQFTRAVTPVSGLLFLSAANATFDLTTGQSYEGGIKTSLTGNGVELTASVFRIRQDDILTRSPTNPAVVVQGGNQRSRGVEVSLNVPVAERLDIGLSGTALEADYGELIEAGGANRSGNRPPNVPERLADLTVTYALASLPLSLSGSVRYNGGFFTSNANNVAVESFTTLDAAATWKAGFGTLTLRGRNLTDEFYADWSGYASGLVFVGAPRNVELSFTKKF